MCALPRPFLSLSMNPIHGDHNNIIIQIAIFYILYSPWCDYTFNKYQLLFELCSMEYTKIIFLLYKGM